MDYENRAGILGCLLVVLVAGLIAHSAQLKHYKTTPKVYSHLQWGPYIDLPTKPTQR